MNLYVGNLSYDMTGDELHRLFSQFGVVKSASVITDGRTGRSKGFGFVEFESASAGQQAINSLNGSDVMGRAIVVNEARPKERKPQGGGSGRPRFSRD